MFPYHVERNISYDFPLRGEGRYRFQSAVPKEHVTVLYSLHITVKNSACLSSGSEKKPLCSCSCYSVQGENKFS